MESLRDFFELLPVNIEDSIAYPFLEEIIITDEIHIAYKKMQEIQQWLTDNISESPEWCIGVIRLDTGIQIFQILFKNPEDVIAFKLRWL